MAIKPFLAMTAAEFHASAVLPEKIAWMACHFSPYGTGLSNLPEQLPAGSLLIINDRIPIHGHDPKIIEDQLQAWFENSPCQGLLLDFQRPDCRETVLLAQHLCKQLSCPVALSEAYAKESDCPVFLPPLPHHLPLEEYLLPWKGREIWLELAREGEVLTLTEKGCTATSLPAFHSMGRGFLEENLHCHYQTEIKENRAEFTLWRTKEDLESVLTASEEFGITTAVGLYQEFRF